MPFTTPTTRTTTFREHPHAEYASVKTAAAVLAVSEKVLRAEITRGRLPAYRVGRLVRIKIVDLEQLREPAR
jgi:excisionase family DNA binding protein